MPQMKPILFIRKVKLKIRFSLLICAFLMSSVACAVTFVEMAEESGIHFKHTDGESGKRLFNEQYGSGGGFFDYDNDGYLDLYLINARPQGEQTVPSPLPTNVLYHNNGDGSFTDVTRVAGMGDTRYGVGATTGDYDNDGDIDLYLTNFGSNALYRNMETALSPMSQRPHRSQIPDGERVVHLPISTTMVSLNSM